MNLQINPNTGLTEEQKLLIGQSIFKKNLAEEGETDWDPLAKNSKGPKAKLMAMRARKGEMDDAGVINPDNPDIDIEDKSLKSMLDGIAELPAGEKTNVLHQAMQELAGVDYPAVHDIKHNADIVRHIRGEDPSSYKSFMNRIVGGAPVDGAGETDRNYRVGKNYRYGMPHPEGPIKHGGGYGGELGDRQINDNLRANAMDPDAHAETNKYFGKAFARNHFDALGQGINIDQAHASAIDGDFRDAGIYQQPDLDLESDGEFLGKGSYGIAELLRDGDGLANAVKKIGNIGPDEFAALHRLKDNPHFPNLLNGKIDRPFEHQAQLAFNPDDSEERRGGMLSNKLNVADKQAFGKYAMSLAPGEDLEDLGIFQEDGGRLGEDEDLKHELIKQFWDIKGQMHKAGIAHNDLHGGNIKYDEENDMMHLIDMGLAEVDDLAAFREAMGGFAGGDYQTNDKERWMASDDPSGMGYDAPYGAMMGRNGGHMPDDLASQLDGNFAKILEKFQGKYASRFDDENDDLTIDHMQKFLQGGLREPKDGGEDWGREDLAEMFGMTETDEEGNRKMTQEGNEELRGYIKQLYDGVSFNPGERKAGMASQAANHAKAMSLQDFENKKPAPKEQDKGNKGWGEKVPSEWGNNPYSRGKGMDDPNFLQKKDLSAAKSAGKHLGKLRIGAKVADKIEGSTGTT